MTTATIKKTDGFILQVTITKQGLGKFSFELHQNFPKANNPFWSRLAQLNLSSEELQLLANVINAEVAAQEVATC